MPSSGPREVDLEGDLELGVPGGDVDFGLEPGLGSQSLFMEAVVAVGLRDPGDRAEGAPGQFGQLLGLLPRLPKGQRPGLSQQRGLVVDVEPDGV